MTSADQPRPRATITGVRIRHLRGTMPTDGVFWEDRVLRGTDLYPDQGHLGRQELDHQLDASTYEVRAWFVEVLTDVGAIGTAGPVPEDVARLVASQICPIALGADAWASERLWDIAYRHLVHGRHGLSMLALSAVDCALWDLRGHLAGAPVHRLLGGPTRDPIPAYASMLGHSVTDLDLVADRARWAREQGFAGQKWFFRRGPADGTAGMAENLAMARTVRETVGDDVDLMFDVWQGWDLPYALRMIEPLAEVRPRWLEEPLLTDRIGSYAHLRERASFPIAGGEHLSTRWDVAPMLAAGALDVVQPDVHWSGGISEVTKIAALASVHDVQTVLHGGMTPVSVHVTAAQPPAQTPYQELLIKWDRIHQHFLRERLEPVDGAFAAPETPGVGIAIDPDRAEHDEVVFEA